jgi:isoquinoline 1-oxidoreductase alpha subunit
VESATRRLALRVTINDGLILRLESNGNQTNRLLPRGGEVVYCIYLADRYRVSVTVTVNGVSHNLDIPDAMPLLWALRDVIGLTGTKYACGIGLCGACTVHLDGAAARSCVVPVAEVGTREVTTIEGLAPAGDHPLQRAWLATRVSQCGYCQPGQIMQAAALLAQQPDAGKEETASTMSHMLCRCGTYLRIRTAVLAAGQGV